MALANLGISVIVSSSAFLSPLKSLLSVNNGYDWNDDVFLTKKLAAGITY